MTLEEIKQTIEELRKDILWGRGDDDGCQIKHLPPRAECQFAMALNYLSLVEHSLQMADYFRMQGE